MNISKVVAERSTCAKIKTAAIIVTDNNNIVSIGYNGVPAGAQHCTDFWAEQGLSDNSDPDFREQHRAWSARFELHAEMNAIIKMPREAMVRAPTIYTLYSPCINCAKCIVSAGIKRVVYEREYSRDLVDTLTFFESAGVDFIRI